MKWIVKIALIVLLFNPVQSWAFRDKPNNWLDIDRSIAQSWVFPNEPNGFRNLYWGESLEDVRKSREVKHLKERNTTLGEAYIITLNERVVGSNPISGSNKNQASEKSGAYFFCRVPQKVPHFIFYLLKAIIVLLSRVIL